MQIRILAGCKRLLMAAAVASLVFAPAGAAPTSKGKQGVSLDSPGAATEDAKIRQPILYPRSNYVWPFASGPVYGEVDASRWNAGGVLHTAVGSFDLTRGMPNFPTELRTTNKLGQLGAQYFLLQLQPEAFTNGLFDQMKSAIGAQGGAIVGEMPVGAFIVRMTPGALQAAQSMGSVIALEPYHPALKLSPEIGRLPLPDPAKANSNVYSLSLRLFPGEDPAVVSAALTKLGVKVTNTYPDTVFVDADRSKLAAIAALEPVQIINETLPIFLMGEETTTTIQTGKWNNGATPYTDAGIDGGGLNKASFADDQLLMVLDSGIQEDAGDLSDTRVLSGTAGASHRKVLFYGTTNAFSGAGDLLGCDNGPQGGFTHGHTVAATALGNASRVAASYGTGFQGTDINGNPWDLDGVAPRARLVAYDGNVTPLTGRCDEPGQGGILAGDLYSGGTSGSLGNGYSQGAKVVNFSWGSVGAVYDANAVDIDQFLSDKGDAMVFVAAGNNSTDTDLNGRPDAQTIGAPATTKNGVAVGSSNNANDQFNANFPNNRSGFSSVGPATTGSNRIAPLIMAPGADAGGMGLASEFNCRSNDNDQNDPVGCDVVQGLAGTSFASPAAAGAALLVRDYFAQGFYPDGTASNPANATDQVSNISGDLVKAVLVASADWMNAANSNLPGGGLTRKFRGNFEQGFGRIQLSNALPLQTFAGAVTGLIVDDGGFNPPGGIIHSTTLTTNLAPGASSGIYALNVCDNTQPLTVSIAWLDPSTASANLSRDLDLKVTSPSTRHYIGNFFQDDKNDNGTIDAGEECTYTGAPWPVDSIAGAIDTGPWSLPTDSCTSAAAHVDTQNNVEAVFLSPDSRLNGITDDPLTGVNEALDNQVETGTWSIEVTAPGTNTGNQNYAIAISGGVCLGSSVRIQKALAGNQLGGGTFVCNDSAVVTVNEIATAGDPAPGLTTTEIASRTTIQVIAADGVTVTDTETLHASDFTAVGGLRFDSKKILLTDGTAPDPGNGVLDVRSGQTIRVTYQDEEPNGTINANAKRVNTGTVDCRTSISAGGFVFGQFGEDIFTLVSGGCEKDDRGYFTFGFPDRYMDEGELVGYLVVFQSAEVGVTLQDVTVSLKAVATDADSPADCKPGAVICADPNRTNNAPSPFLTVLDSPKVLGTLPAAQVLSPSFTIQVAGSITGVQQADMVLGVSAKTAGKGVEAFAVQRETLNADEVSFYYSTDFPTGGSEPGGGIDVNNNEVLEAVTNSTNNFLLDYVKETQSYSDLTAGGFNSTAALQIPWNFDTNDGGFRGGLQNTSVPGTGTIAEWSEDKNYNGILDGFCTLATTLPCSDDNGISEGCDRCANDSSKPCFTSADCVGAAACTDRGTCNFALGEDRDTASNSQMDKGWNTLGGCGWQTKDPTKTTGGVWHTGLISTLTPTACIAATGGRCQNYERTPNGNLSGDNNWWEVLLTPVLTKVNQCPAVSGNCPRADLPNDPTYQVAILDWAWNMSIDFPDLNTALLAEFDTDTEKIEGAEFFNDGILTNIPIFGNQGAISGGNGPITGGFNMFAQVSKCVDTDDNGSLDHCGTATGTACTDDVPCTGNDLSPTRLSSGNNRESANNCAFQGKTAGVIKAQQPYGLAIPPDDDVANSYCERSDALNGVDKSVRCIVGSNQACTNVGAPYTICHASDAVIDEFVQRNGPGRNYGVSVPNGPDMRFSTLEDLYGDTGTHFQAALGLYNAEPTPGTLGGGAGFGVAVDDMVIKWKETRLDADTHSCAGSGECADLEVKSTLSYDGNALVELTVTDRTPYDAVNNKNDCDGNGSFADAGDDQDCNNNGALDVTVKLTSLSEPTGEIAVLDAISVGSPVYKTRFPYSSSYNSPGSLYVQRTGTANPVVTARYEDRNDGTNNRCKNALDPTQQGFIAAAATVNITAGRIALKGYTMTLVGTPGVNGDDDNFADANETLDLAVTFTNKSGVDVDDLVATLGTTDPNIACISKPIVSVGSLLNKGVATAPPFRFKVANVSRTTVDQVLRATFTLTLRSNRFDVLTRSMSLTLDLDLNAAAPGTTSAFVEGFEAASGFGLFTIDTLDAGKNNLVAVNGMRCQYNDPDFINTNGPGNPDCFLGFAGDPTSGVNDWHVHKNNPANGNVGRAYLGAQSLHYGVHVGTTAKRDTTRLRQLDAIRTTASINLPLTSANPELVFAHQASLVDSRLITNIGIGEATDRGVVELQLADTGGTALGPWIKLTPYENEYDQQGTDDFFNCTFDPTDDGNNEDSFFSPSDPGRRLGPSSTCFPEFTYARSGCTDYRLPSGTPPGTCTADNLNIGLAFDGPGLTGTGGFPGTWVKPRFSLTGFSGRRVRIRFVATTIELGTTSTWDAAVQRDDLTSDDGWYVDDVRIDTALSSPIALSVDSASATGLACGTCSSIVPALVATPTPPLSGPGQIVTLDAKTSTIDVCLNGTPQFQFWTDDGDDIVGNGTDTLLRDWTDNSKFVDAPQVTTTYGVKVRCSTDPACDSATPGNATTTLVTVTCPSTGNALAKFTNILRVSKPTLTGVEPDQNSTLSWGVATSVDAVRGNLGTVRASQTLAGCVLNGPCDGNGTFAGSGATCIADNQNVASIVDNTAASTGQLFYWLVRPTVIQFCNQAVFSYSAEGAVREDTNNGRDAGIAATCP